MSEPGSRPDAKARTLRRHGALHPQPEVVGDELFENDGFFDRRDLVQVRYEMLRRVRVERCPVSETATRYGVSRPTYYKLDADFEAGGILGLLPRKRGPKAGHKLSPEVVEALAEASAGDPAMGSEALARLARERFDVEVHPRSVTRALQRREKKRP